MKLTRRPKLCVEFLEHRDCPSYVLRLAGGNLFVTGAPTGAGQPGTVFLQKNNNQWQVTDGASSLGTYNAANVYLRVAQHQNTPLTFNLNGKTDSGNITVDLGKGDTSDSQSNGLSLVSGTLVGSKLTAPTAGTLAGNFTVLNGSGVDLVHIGFTSGNAETSSSTITIGGDVSWFAHSNSNFTSGGFAANNILDTGFNLSTATDKVTPTVKIGGSVTGVATGVEIAALTTVGRDVTVTSLSNALQSGGPANVQIYGNVGRNVTITGSRQSAGDIVFVGGGSTAAGVLVPTQIGGNLSISTPGSQTNIIEISNGGAGASTTVNGNTFIQTGDGTNLLTTDAIFNGNLTFQLGNGVNTDTTTAPGSSGAAPLGLFPSDAVVNGNFQLSAANGANNLTTTGNPFAGEVDGNTFITLGNGANAPFNVSSTALNGKFYWNSGNGNDTLNLAGAAAYNVNAQFGNGDDSFALSTAGASLTGSVNGGGRLLGNSFFQAAGTNIISPFAEINFP